MMKELVTACAIFLSGCDSEVGRRYFHDEVRVVQMTQSCSTGPGICCTTGLTMGGRYKTGCGFYQSCPGKEPVTMKIIPFEEFYESGKVKRREAHKVISVNGECTRP